MRRCTQLVEDLLRPAGVARHGRRISKPRKRFRRLSGQRDSALGMKQRLLVRGGLGQRLSEEEVSGPEGRIEREGPPEHDHCVLEIAAEVPDKAGGNGDRK